MEAFIKDFEAYDATIGFFGVLLTLLITFIVARGRRRMDLTIDLQRTFASKEPPEAHTAADIVLARNPEVPLNEFHVGGRHQDSDKVWTVLNFLITLGACLRNGQLKERIACDLFLDTFLYWKIVFERHGLYNPNRRPPEEDDFFTTWPSVGFIYLASEKFIEIKGFDAYKAAYRRAQISVDEARKRISAGRSMVPK